MATFHKNDSGRMERTIDKTRYVVKLYFNPDAKEDAKTKMKNLIQYEIRNGAIAS